jgi:hypothetical protein
MPIRMLHTSRFSVMSQRGGGVQHGKKPTEIPTRFLANFPKRGSMLYVSLCRSFSKWFHLSILIFCQSVSAHFSDFCIPVSKGVTGAQSRMVLALVTSLFMCL